MCLFVCMTVELIFQAKTLCLEVVFSLPSTLVLNFEYTNATAPSDCLLLELIWGGYS